MGTRYTGQDAKVATFQDTGGRRFTQLTPRVLDGNPANDSPVQMTRTLASAMGKRQTTDPNNGMLQGISVTQVRAKIMRLRTPNFEWIEMFIDEVFPYDISYNSQATTMFSTDVAMVDSGFTQRSSRWAQPMMSYDVAYGVRTMEQLQGLMQFFRVMEGRKHAFRFLDHMDSTSTMAVRVEARSVPATSPFDQLLGLGDGNTITFQLRKGYTVGSVTRWRPIYKPIGDSVSISVDDQEVSNWSCDDTTGLVTFSTPYSLVLDNIVVTTPDAGSVMFTASSGTFAQFAVGDRIQTGGFDDTENNTVDTQNVAITAISALKESITVNRPNAFGKAATNQDQVTIQKHPAPKLGKQIKAGFQFHVPVRFDTDELPTTLEYYGIGSAQQVKLIEVRPSELVS